ncbi:hypothetical protein AAMO2058_000780900 [Amorphochlora amoebiformis]
MQRFRALRKDNEGSSQKGDSNKRQKLIEFVSTKVLNSKIRSFALRREVGLCLAALLDDAPISLLKRVFERIKPILSATKRDIENRLCALECVTCLILKLKRQFAALFFSAIIQIAGKQIRDSNDEIREVSIEVVQYLVDECGTQGQTSDISRLLNRGSSDRSARVRFCAGLAIGRVVHRLENIKELNLFTQPCQRALADPSPQVRVCFASALGSLFACAALTHSQQKAQQEAYVSIDRGLSCLQTFFIKEQSPQSRAMFAQSVVMLLRKTSDLVRASSTTKIANKLLSFIQLNPKGASAAIRTDADARQSSECVCYMIWHGVMPCINDRGLEELGEALCSRLQSQVRAMEAKTLNKGGNLHYNESECMVCLKAISLVVIRMGSQVEDSSFKKGLIDSIFFLCTAARSCARLYASHCLRQLIRAAPDHAAMSVRFLENFLRVTLSSLEGNDKLNAQTYYQLHGQVTALAAVASVIPTTPCGVPMSLISRVFDGTCALLTKYRHITRSGDGQLWSALLERCWQVIGSLSSFDYDWLAPRMGKLSSLYEAWLGDNGVLRPIVSGKAKNKIDEVSASRLVSGAGSSLEALKALYVAHSKCRGRIGVRALLTAVLNLRLIGEKKHDIVVKSDGSPSYPRLNRALDHAKADGFDLLSLVPSSMFQAHFRPVLYMTVAQFTSRNTPAAKCIIRRLNPLDDTLKSDQTPLPSALENLSHRSNWQLFDNSTLWIGKGGSKDPLEWPLPRTFPEEWVIPPGDLEAEGMQGLAELGAFTCGVRLGIHTGRNGDQATAASSKRTDPPSSAIRLFGKIFPDQSPVNQAQLLDHFHALVRKTYEMYKTRRPGPDAPPNVLLNIASALLTLCLQLHKCGTLAANMNSGTKKKLLQVSFGLNKHPNVALRRIVAETLGVLCAWGGQSLASPVRTSLQNCLELKNKAGICGGALALACVHRYSSEEKIRYGSELRVSVAALLVKGQELPDRHRAWVIHSLATAIGSSKLGAGMDLVLPILPLLFKHVLSHKTSALMPTPLALQTAGELVHGMAAALGKDLTTDPNSKLPVVSVIAKLMVVLEQLEDHCLQTLKFSAHVGAVDVRADQLAGLLESVLKTFKLFLAQGSNALKWLSIPRIWSLTHQSLSNAPTEKAKLHALECLMIWTEMDKTLMESKSLESQLLGIHDSEASPRVKNAVEKALFTLIHQTLPARSYAMAPEKKKKSKKKRSILSASYSPPPLWRVMDVYKRAVVGNRRLPSDAKRDRNKMSQNQETKKENTDMADGMVVSRDTGTTEVRKEYGMETKAAASRCLENALTLAQTRGETKIVDVEAAHVASLIDQVSDLITVSCMAAGQQTRPLRQSGLHLLAKVIEIFGAAVDPNPDMEGSLMLQQYVGQLSSTLRGGLKPHRGDSDEPYHSPSSFQAGVALAAKLLPTVLRSDRTATKRLVGMLTAPLDKKEKLVSSWKLYYDSAAVTEGALATLRTLMKMIENEPKAKVLVKAQPDALGQELENVTGLLRGYCISAALDGALVRTQRRSVVGGEEGVFFDGKESSNLRKVYSRWADELLCLGLSDSSILESSDIKQTPAETVTILTTAAVNNLAKGSLEYRGGLSCLKALITSQNLTKGYLDVDVIGEVLEILAGKILHYEEPASYETLSSIATITASVSIYQSSLTPSPKPTEEVKQKQFSERNSSPNFTKARGGVLQKLVLLTAHLLRLARRDADAGNPYVGYAEPALKAAGALSKTEFPEWKGLILEWSSGVDNAGNDAAATVEAFFSADADEEDEEPNPELFQQTILPPLLSLSIPLLTKGNSTVGDAAVGSIAVMGETARGLGMSEVVGGACASVLYSGMEILEEKKGEEENQEYGLGSMAQSLVDLSDLACQLSLDCSESLNLLSRMLGGEAGSLCQKAVVLRLAHRSNHPGSKERNITMFATVLAPVLGLLRTCQDTEAVEASARFIGGFAKVVKKDAGRHIVELVSPVLIAHLRNEKAKGACLGALEVFRDVHPSFDSYAKTLPQGVRNALEQGCTTKAKAKVVEESEGSTRKKIGKKKRSKKAGKKKKQKKEELSIDFSQF